jgi:hypothetical protein
MAKTTARTTKKQPDQQPEPDKDKQTSKLPAKMGRPRRFKTEQEFQAAYEAYIRHCYDSKMMPTKAGFCAYAGLTRETYYQQRNHYPDTFHAIDLCLEDFAANQHSFTGIPSLPNALQYSRYAYNWDKASKDDSSVLDVEIDIDEETLDLMMSKLGYLPDPDL